MKFYAVIDPEWIAQPRATKHGAYTPEKSKDCEREIVESYTMAGGESYGRQPVSVRIDAVFRVPKSASKEKQQAMKAGDILPAKKLDVDDIMEAVCNALNGIAYHDVAQVMHCEVSKSYGLISGLFVEIVPMGDEML